MILSASVHGVAAITPGVSIALRQRLSNSEQFINPLVVPAEIDLIDLIAFSGTDAPWPRAIKYSRRPTVALVGDDPGTLEGCGGPDAWTITPRVARWARGVIVHASGGESEHYAAAVKAVRQLGRVALIETTSVHAAAWRDRLGCPRTLLILPLGGVHPIGCEAA